VKLGPSDEQLLIGDMLDKLFKSESTPERIRLAEQNGFDAALWKQLAELGILGLRVPVDRGGAGASILTAVTACEFAGRRLASVPLVEALVAARVLAQMGTEDANGSLASLLCGEVVIVLALKSVSEEPECIPPSGRAANAILAVDGDEVVLIRRRQADRSLGIWHLGGVNERLTVGRGKAACDIFAAAVEEWKLLAAAQLGGMAAEALDIAAGYARERIQFGRPIGSFQGVAHPLADALTDCRAGALLVRRAAWTIATGREDAAALVSLCWWWATQSAFTAVRRSVRTMGGYGLTIEFDMHLYNRRANVLALAAGDPYAELEKAAERLFHYPSVPLPDASDVGIDFGLSGEAETFKARTRAIFESHLTPANAAKGHHSTSSHDSAVHQALAQGGILFADWPVTEGGEGRTAEEMYASSIVFEEVNYTTHILGTTSMVGRIVAQFATPEAKVEIVPHILDGSALCSLGFSEPGSGSDVFSARTSATAVDGEWLVNGQKMFTTGAHLADYVLLLARTDPDAAKHAGLTLFIVPTALPGFSLQPVHTYQDERTNITFYDNMRVPDRYRLGEVNGGVTVMAAALELEHGSASLFLGQQRMWDATMRWALAGEPGSRPVDRPSVAARLAIVRARYEAGAAMVAQLLWSHDNGIHDRAAGPMTKLFITECYLKSAWEILEMGGPDSLAHVDENLDMVELGHRRAYATTIYGGTSEIHRSLVAEQALRLPKSRS
jgi:3-oxochol-4-en-24-oyl-CoA dehydrogenase